MMYSYGYALAFSFFPLLAPFPFCSFSSIGLRNTIFPSNTSITCGLPVSSVPAMICLLNSFSSSFWIMRLMGRAPNCGSKPVVEMWAMSSSLGMRWMSFSSSFDEQVQLQLHDLAHIARAHRSRSAGGT